MPNLASTSVIITSYNQESTLRLLLASLERQSKVGFEVLVADDGSSDGTAALCQARRPYSLKFVTQADQGYRKSKIVNEAIRRSEGEYLIFLDGDVILERHFIEDHLSLRKAGHFICGRRVDLGPNLSQRITVEDVIAGRFDHWDLEMVLSSLRGDTVSLKRAWRVTHPWVRKLLGYHRSLDLLGSNFSAWRADIVSVNGFNEGLESYWGEDGDLFIRLRNSGKFAINAKSMCIQYHIFHARREPTRENVESYNRLLAHKDYKWALKGLK